MDRQIMAFLTRAGITVLGYEEVQLIIRKTAQIVEIYKYTIDDSIWTFGVDAR